MTCDVCNLLTSPEESALYLEMILLCISFSFFFSLVIFNTFQCPNYIVRQEFLTTVKLSIGRQLTLKHFGATEYMAGIAVKAPMCILFFLLDRGDC